MKKIEDCFLTVKNDYLKFLSKEKIFDKSEADKIKNLKKTYIPMSFWIEDKYKKKEISFKSYGLTFSKQATLNPYKLGSLRGL